MSSGGRRVFIWVTVLTASGATATSRAASPGWKVRTQVWQAAHGWGGTTPGSLASLPRG